MTDTLITSLIAALAINMLMFLIAFRWQSDKLTDVSYALTFIVVILISAIRAITLNVYSIVLIGMVCVWALRIGSFLLIRVMRVGKDRRFDGTREHFWKFGKFWLGQALTVWLLLLPATLALYKQNRQGGSIAGIGLIVWLIGLSVESLADYQKYTFSQDPHSRNRWIQEGIWRYSRHPNYFGEIVVWVGLYLYTLQSLSGPGKIIGLASPIFIATLLFFVSGVPILEKSADQRWGNISEYRQYKKQTSLIVPIPRSNCIRRSS